MVMWGSDGADAGGGGGEGGGGGGGSGSGAGGRAPLHQRHRRIELPCPCSARRTACRRGGAFGLCIRAHAGRIGRREGPHGPERASRPQSPGGCGLDPALKRGEGFSHRISRAGIQPHWVTPSRSLDQTSPKILPRLSSPVYMRPVRQFRFPYVHTKARFSRATSHSKASAEPA